MQVLAADTTTERGSVALLRDGEVVGEVRFRPRQNHSVSLLPAVAFLLREEGVPPGELDGFAVTLGPGSFTGLRVGISTVQGLALAASRPAVGLSTLEVLAARIEGAGPVLVAAVDAFRGEVFRATFDGHLRPLGPPERVDARSFVEGLPAGAVVIGDAALKHAAEIRARGIEISSRSLFLASTLGRLAGPRLLEGQGVPPSRLSPLYMREADIRKP